jgi:predicted Na+-dependent transporter
MNRKGFFVAAWEEGVRPVIRPALLILAGIFLLKFNFSNFSGFEINWGAIGRFFAGIVKNYWQVLLFVFLLMLVPFLLQKFIFPSHGQAIKKITNAILIIAGLAIIFNINYKYYQSGQYNKIIWFAVLFCVYLVIGYVRRENKTG